MTAEVPIYLVGLGDDAPEVAAGGAARLSAVPAAPASVRLAQVDEQRVAWLADGLVPWGALTQVVGRGGQGKTTFAAHVAARLSRGQPVFPGMAAPAAADVLIVSAEDSIPHVLRPRLRIAGADLERVHAWNIGEHDLVLPDGTDLLEQEVERTGARLVVIDPLAAFLSGRVDSHRDAGVRGVLRPLHALAERTGIAVLGILHVNQASGGDVAVRVSGSGAWVNAARSALVFGPPPDAEDGDPRRVVALAKSNYAPLGASYDVTLRVPDGEEHPVITYAGQSAVRARDVLTGPWDEDERTGAQDCAEWLAAALAGGERPSQDVKRDAKAAGFTPKNLRQARERLSVVARRGGFPSGTYWSLPDTT